MLGSYRLLAELGRGGMGVVHRAEHIHSGARVAIKTVRIANRRTIAGLRAEVLALKRVDHPSVVRIVAEGLNEGLPWYAMELIEGQTLAEYNANTWRQGDDSAAQETLLGSVTRDSWRKIPIAAQGGPEFPARKRQPAANGRLLETLELYIRLCAALSYIHGQGIVHRDLKPNNVFVRPDGTPVLVDFGLVSNAFGSLGRESLGAAEQALGTVSYAAPEQISGQFVDARADLYAVGCMLFESLTGEPPLRAESARSLLQQHQQKQAVPPSEYVDSPRALDELVMRLLAKTAKQRVGNAEDVARELATIVGRTLTAKELNQGIAPAYLYRPSIAGRAEVLQQLADSRKQALAAKASLVFIGGESGIGKTFLASEVVRAASLEQFQVVTGECSPVAGIDAGGPEVNGAPLHPFRSLFQAMADRCQEEGEQFAHWLFGSSLGVLADFEPSLSQLSSLFGNAQRAESRLSSPEVGRRQLLRAITETVARLAEHRPLLLVLDDLQWADELSLSVLDAFTPEFLAHKQLLVLGTYRAEEATGGLERLLSRPDVRAIILERLSESTIASIVSDMLGVPSVPSGLVKFLVERSEGNPFFVAEYLRAAAADRVLRREGGRWRLPDDDHGSIAGYETLPLPRSIHGLILQRLQGLGETARATADAASVLGREFELELLCGTLRADEQTTAAVVDYLRQRQIVENGSGGSIRFVHDRLRESAYERLLPERRRELHRLAAQAVEARYSDSEEFLAQQAVLASHWSMAQVPEKACDYFRKAADRARAAFANDDAVMLYRAALQEARSALTKDTDHERQWRAAVTGLYENIGDLQTKAGRQDDARLCFELAEQQFGPHPSTTQARLLRKLSKTHELQHRYAQTLTLLDAAQRILETTGISKAPASDGWWREWLDIQNHKIWTYYWTAQLDSMTECISLARAVLDQHGSDSQRAHFYQLFSLLRMRQERFLLSEGTVELAKLAFDAIQGQGASELPAVYLTYAFALLFNGRNREAEEALNGALVAAERARDNAVQARALTYLLIVMRRADAVAETRRLAARLFTIASIGQMKHYLGAAQASQGWVALKDGDMRKASQCCESAMLSWEGAMPSVFPFKWLALFPQLVLCLSGDGASNAGPLVSELLDVSQQRMPDDLNEALSNFDDDPAALRSCLNLASRLGYL